VRAGLQKLFKEADADASVQAIVLACAGRTFIAGADITEFGKTPLFSRDELASAGVAIQLFPLSAFRAANKAAESVYEAVRRDGHQKSVVEAMQTREELYDRIGYHAFERKLDTLFADPKAHITPLKGSELWQCALLEAWLQTQTCSYCAEFRWVISAVQLDILFPFISSPYNK